MSFQISTPQRHKAGKDAFNIRPKKLADWIEGLPRANLGETARQIFSVLKETNGYHYRHQDRFHFLETMREPVLYATSSMKKHFVGVSLPLPDKGANVAKVTSQLFRNMATGYLIAIEDMLNSHMLFTDKKMLATLIHRAISYQGMAMLTAFQTYAPYPASCWQVLHQLYQLAEKYKLLKQSVADYQHRYMEKTSLRSEYLRLVMLSLCSPYRLRQGEVGKVYDTLERWVHLVELHGPDQKGDSEQCLFGLDLSSASAPVAVAFLEMDQAVTPTSLRFVDTRKLAGHLRDESRDNQDVGSTTLTGIDMSRPDLSFDLMNRLLIAWGMGTRRHFPRTDRQEEVSITVGLTATHQFIGHRNQQGANSITFNDKYTHRAEFKSSNIKNDPVETSRDVWSMIYPSESGSLQPLVEDELRLVDPGAESAAASGEATTYQSLNWVVLNESATGYLLQCETSGENRVQVGELIGVRRNKNGKGWKWGIGAIRWMRYNSQHTLQIGVEMLNPDAAAIGIRFIGNEHPYQRTLMLPELKNLKQPATLITGPVPWRVGNKVNINILGKEIRATLTKSMQNTGMFAQFQFELDDEVTHPPRQDEIPETQDFSTIWASI